MKNHKLCFIKNNYSPKGLLEIGFLFIGIALIFFFSLSWLPKPTLNVDTFRDFIFLNEIFNKQLILHGAPSGIKNVLHGVMGYWILYPLVIIFHDYFLIQTLITIINILALSFFVIWINKKFSSVFSIVALIYILSFFPTHLFTPCHLAFTMLFYCMLFYFLISNKLLEVFVCTFFLFQFNIINWILFFPCAFISLKQKNYKIFFPSLVFIFYFLINIVHTNHSNIFDLSFLEKVDNFFSSSYPRIIQFVISLLGIFIYMLYKKGKLVSSSLSDYLTVFYIVYSILSFFLFAKIIYFVIPTGLSIGFVAHLIYQEHKKHLEFIFIPIITIALLLLTLFNIGKVKEKINLQTYTQNINMPVNYFLNNTLVNEENMYNRSVSCKSSIYIYLISSEFNNNNRNALDKYFLTDNTVFGLYPKTRKFNSIKLKFEFKNTDYKLYSVDSQKIKNSNFNISYPPLYLCLDYQQGYNFYNSKHNRFENISLIESYSHYKH